MDEPKGVYKGMNSLGIEGVLNLIMITSIIAPKRRVICKENIKTTD